MLLHDTKCNLLVDRHLSRYSKLAYSYLFIILLTCTVYVKAYDYKLGEEPKRIHFGTDQACGCSLNTWVENLYFYM